MHFVLVCETNKDPMTELVRVQGPHMFTLTEYTSVWKVFCAKFINITSTFVWNYLDTFIMTISIALSTQFELFNNELIQAKHEVCFFHFYFFDRKKCHEWLSEIWEIFFSQKIVFFSSIAYVSGVLDSTAKTIQKIM